MSIIKTATSTLQAVPKLYDVIMSLMGRVEKFPRSQKFTLGDRIVNISLDTLDLLRLGTGPLIFSDLAPYGVLYFLPLGQNLFVA